MEVGGQLESYADLSLGLGLAVQHLIVFPGPVRQTQLSTDCRPALQKNWDTDLHFKADFSCGTSRVNRTNPPAIERTLSDCTSTTTLRLLALTLQHQGGSLQIKMNFGFTIFQVQCWLYLKFFPTEN